MGAVLKSVSGFEMYRKRYGRIAPERIVEFLLLDGEFPRAVSYCVRLADNSLHTITGTRAGAFSCRTEQLWACCDRNWITPRWSPSCRRAARVL